MKFNLLLYAKMTDGAGKRLRRVIEALVLKENTEMYQTIDSLCRRLRQPRNDLPVAVLLAASRQDLLELLSIRDLLDDIRIILVLPDREDGTIAKGHRLLPRFLTYADSDFLDVAAVLIKMQRSADARSNTYWSRIRWGKRMRTLTSIESNSIEAVSGIRYPVLV